MLKSLLFTVLVATGSQFAAASTAAYLTNTEPRTVAQVDLSRYVGQWYEIGSIPQWFQLGCTGTTATYDLREDGKVGVLNRCNLGFVSGPAIDVKGVATVVDPASNAKLLVDFGRGRSGDYWILALADDYSSAMVGGPDRDTLWILSREKTLDPETTAALLEQAKADGFPTDKVRWTKQ